MSTDHIVAKLVKSGAKIEIYTYNSPLPVGFEKSISNSPPKDGEEGRDKRLDNMFRARQSVRRLIWCNVGRYPKFLTLTYSDAEFDISRVRRDIFNFLKKMKRRGYDLKYLYVLEHQKNRGKKENNIGSLHVHMVLFNDEFIPHQVLHDCWSKGQSLDVHVIDDVRDLGAYVCKYITKDAVAEFGGHCYECSQGLKRPEIERIYLEGYSDSGTSPRALSAISRDVTTTYESQVEYDGVYKSIGKVDFRHLQINYKQAFVDKNIKLSELVNGGEDNED